MPITVITPRSSNKIYTLSYKKLGAVNRSSIFHTITSLQTMVSLMDDGFRHLKEERNHSVSAMRHLLFPGIHSSESAAAPLVMMRRRRRQQAAGSRQQTVQEWVKSVRVWLALYIAGSRTDGILGGEQGTHPAETHSFRPLSIRQALYGLQ